ncbi:hypothetical protein [Curtobacterium ammoniigenes]|uniref:hypothetical protein n=1 Tax=Curtobacterium ammoniigenes TaxID=395387 RepID=UPI000832E54E|nr:hypothetical protein [Curtobacterium ammoniigenes]
MGIGSWSGGIVLLIAAVLWVVYLMPAWHARRQYLATERNAIRLQQTLRILAETAELPDEVRVELNAKSLAEARRVAASEEARRRAIVRAQEAARQREITRRLAEQAPELARVSAAPALSTIRMRRSRLGATGLGVIGLTLAIVTLVAAPGLWLLWVAGLIALAGSTVVLAQLSAVARARRARQVTALTEARRASRPTPRTRATTATADDATRTAPERTDASASRAWTPTQLPKPIYMTTPDVVAETESSAVLAARLRERVAAAATEAAAAADAAAAAERAERAAMEAAAADPTLARVVRMPARESEEPVVSAATAERGDVPGAGAPSAGAARLEERLGLRAAAAPARPDSTPLGTPSPFAGMGVIDEDAYERPDLDAVLRRRRQRAV